MQDPGATGDDEARLLDVVERALDVDPADRADWLAVHCPEPLRAQALRMCARAEDATDELDLAFVRELEVTVPDLAGTRLGAYRLRELLGEGGMGRVYRAERSDGAFERQVAIKVIAASGLGSRAAAQLETERQLLSDLAHPNIATLLDGGTTPDGLPFVVMELVSGAPLDVYARERDLSVEARIELFLAVCSAVEHAHRALVVHRDIKPSNILVDRSGQPKLLDFGIAKSLAEERRDGAQTVAMLHTPAYASPEQLTGGPLTTSTDVYSLGVVLYELLTRLLPFDPEGLPPMKFARRVVDELPQAPSARVRDLGGRHARRLEGDLDAIVLRALAKSPTDRYPAVSALSDDLRAFLRGAPVSARGNSPIYRATSWLRRGRVGVASALSASVVAVVAVVVWSARSPPAARPPEVPTARAVSAPGLALTAPDSRDPTWRGRVDIVKRLAGDGQGDEALRLLGIYLDELGPAGRLDVIADLLSLRAQLHARAADEGSAEADLDRALTMVTAALESAPDDADLLARGAHLHAQRAALERRRARWPQAAEAGRRAVGLARRRMAARDDAEAARGLAWAQLALAAALHGFGDRDGACAQMTEARAVWGRSSEADELTPEEAAQFELRVEADLGRACAERG